MIRLALLSAFVLYAMSSSAQQMTGSFKSQTPDPANWGCSAKRNKGKFATFGFDLGVNRSNLQFGSTQENGDQITNGTGYRLGLFSNFQMTRRFSIAPKAEMSFNATRLDQSNASYNVNAVNMEFLGHLKYKLLRSSFSPYILSGPNFRVPIQRNDQADVPVREDWAIDFGAGLDIPLGVFKMSPEIRYSYGLSNFTSSDNFSDLRYHNIALVVIFSDL